MARRQTNRLMAPQLSKLPRGMHPDGGNLWLQVSPAGTRSWSFRYTAQGKQREMGLGPLHTITLAEARTRATEARRQLLDGIDPIEHRKSLRAAAALAAASTKTFKECAEAYIAAHTPGWKNPKHAAQWTATLATYAFPVFGDLPVNKVDRALVLRVLNPIWTTKTETASRVRQRIEKILDWAKVQGYRSGENPAELKGNLAHDLPKQSKVATVENHPALDHALLPEFMALLGRRNSMSAQALKLLILTASRTGEVREAEWSEFDLEARLWTRPAKRMKAHKEHAVPLGDAAMAVLETMKGLDKKFVFPGGKPGTALSNMAMSEFLKGMNGEPAKYVDRRSKRPITVHGFRSTFSDWAAEETHFPTEVREMSLAHAIGDKTEAAYRRGELLAKRRELMDAWAAYAASAPVKVTAEDKVLAVAGQMRKAGGRSPNRAVRDAIDAVTAFADVDLGSGPVAAPDELKDLVRKSDRPAHRKADPSGADEMTPPDFQPSLDARSRPARRLAEELELRERG